MGFFSGLSSIFSSEDEWFCDGCGRKMNDQAGFTTSNSSWTCSECGFDNDVSSANLYGSHEDYLEANGIPSCPECGGTVRGDSPDAQMYFNCQSCDARFRLEGGELVSTTAGFSSYSAQGTSSGRECGNCYYPLEGEYVSAWENFNNPYGFVTCKTCGHQNIVDDG